MNKKVLKSSNKNVSYDSIVNLTTHDFTHPTYHDIA